MRGGVRRGAEVAGGEALKAPGGPPAPLPGEPGSFLGSPLGSRSSASFLCEQPWLLVFFFF